MATVLLNYFSLLRFLLSLLVVVNARCCRVLVQSVRNWVQRRVKGAGQVEVRRMLWWS